LGIDVGSSRRKVFNFCLVHSDGAGAVEVRFERGGARDRTYPPSNAGVFEDLTRATWLSATAEAGAIQILDQSALTQLWIEERARWSGGCDFGVCIDAPSGFAVPPHHQRETEAQGFANFPTPSLPAFLRQVSDYSNAHNNTPLRQRYFWKLIGLVAFRYFIHVATGVPLDMPPAEVTTACMAFGQTRIREGFPSDTYQRANGNHGVLAPDARAVLSCLAHAGWVAYGNIFKDLNSAPNRRISALLAHQHHLRQDLAEGADRIPTMQRVGGDPAWADLWDAFACAFVACCEFQGCGGFVGLDEARMGLEGAFLKPTEVR